MLTSHLYRDGALQEEDVVHWDQRSKVEVFERYFSVVAFKKRDWL